MASANHGNESAASIRCCYAAGLAINTLDGRQKFTASEGAHGCAPCGVPSGVTNAEAGKPRLRCVVYLPRMCALVGHRHVVQACIEGNVVVEEGGDGAHPERGGVLR